MRASESSTIVTMAFAAMVVVGCVAIARELSVEDSEHRQRLELQKRDYEHQRELQKQKDRSEIASQLVRAGMIMNGGGAIALLAFVQASLGLDDFPDLARWAAVAISVFIVGLFLVGAANYLRIKVSLADNEPDSFGKRLRIRVSRALQFGSIVLFIAGCGVFAASYIQDSRLAPLVSWRQVQ